MLSIAATTPPPESSAARDAALAELVEGYLARLQAGEAIDPSVFAAEHPEHAERLARLLPALELMDDLRRSSIHPGSGLSLTPVLMETPGIAPGLLGDFQIVREVGRGGMGVVYEARQISLDRRVALKVLPMAAAMDPRQLQRFQLEAKAAACLHHTNIVPVHAVGCERGVHYYAMQFIEGQTLAAIIGELRALEAHVGWVKPTGPPAADGAGVEGIGGFYPPYSELASRLAGGELAPADPVPPPLAAKASSGPLSSTQARSRAFFRTVADLGIQAAEAIEHAHDLGVVHRDIKPANILVDDCGTLWITDFGLARLRNDSGLTMTGDLMGTLRYMSPEQAMGRAVDIDHRTDIYSLAVTLYELMTGKPAIAGQDRHEVLRQIANDEPAPPRQLEPAIPRELETIVLKAMSKEAISRYATAQDLADDLRRFLEHKPIKARRPKVLERAAKWSRRHRTATIAAAIILILATAGLGASTVLIARERAEVVRQRDRARVQLEAATAARDAEVRAREQAEAVSRFLVDAFRRPDPSQGGRELKVVDLLTSATMKLDTEFAGSPQIKAELLNALGLTFDGLGLPARAAEMHEKARSIRERLLGSDHLDTLSSCNNLVEAYLGAGRAIEAIALCESTLKLRESRLGPDHRDTLDSRHNLACAYEKVGRIVEAIRMHEENLKIRESKLGADHSDTLHSRNGLAAALSSAGRFDEALAHFRDTLKLRESKLGPDHPETLVSRNNLAFALTNVGRVAESIPLIEATLEQRESKLGPDHPSTIRSRNNLAAAHRRAGRHDRSAPLFELVLRQTTAKLGPDHPQSIRAQANLAVNYLDVGRPADAVRLMEEAFRRARGRPDAMEVMTIHLGDLARAYEACGRFAQAEPLYREELGETRKSLGPHDPRTATAMTRLGRNLLRQEKWSEAERVLRESLALREKTQPDAWLTFNNRWLLGGALLGQNKYAEADRLLVQGYEGMRAREATFSSAGRVSLTQAARQLVGTYEQRDRRAEAASWRARLGPDRFDAMMPTGVDAFAR